MREHISLQCLGKHVCAAGIPGAWHWELFTYSRGLTVLTAMSTLITCKAKVNELKPINYSINRERIVDESLLLLSISIPSEQGPVCCIGARIYSSSSLGLAQ